MAAVSGRQWGGDAVTLAGRLIGILDRVAVEKRPCKLCGVDLYALPVRDKPQPVWYSKNGVAHQIDCAKLLAGQTSLFDKRPTPE